jgi:hypothetical protein
LNGQCGSVSARCAESGAFSGLEHESPTTVGRWPSAVRRCTAGASGLADGSGAGGGSRLRPGIHHLPLAPRRLTIHHRSWSSNPASRRRLRREDLQSLIGRSSSLGSEPVRRHRHVDVSAIVQVDAISPESVSRVTNMLMAAAQAPGAKTTNCASIPATTRSADD